MFSLIITIVSIALVVALVAATMYYGGDTLTQGRTGADASAFVAGAQQVAGAQVMDMSLNGTTASTVAALITDKVLTAAPVVKGSAWTIDPVLRIVSSVVNDANTCNQINKTAGLTAALTAAAADTDAAMVVVAADYANLSYGCESSTKTFKFKY